MKFTSSIILIIALIAITCSCNNGPQAISYNQDACDFCRMTIVDKQHAAQIVTEKGRNYKYDAIECMVNDLKNWDRPVADQLLVADFANPGKLLAAQNANYLICKKISSPMGAYLSAFENETKINLVKNKYGGEVFTWTEIKEKLNN